MRLLSLFGIGGLFALGLAISGMAQPNKVLGFLDVLGTWDPVLAFVMGSALLVTHFGYRSVLKGHSPLLAAGFNLPTGKDIDIRLVTGASIFGIGWGMSGLCPGPALVNVGSGDSGILIFVAAMFVGFILKDILDLTLLARSPQPAAS